MIRRMEEEFINYLMVGHMMEIGKMTRKMEEEFTYGLMEKYMTENG